MTEAVFQNKAATQDAKLDTYETRIESIETLGGLAPGDTSDATMAGIAANPESHFAKELRESTPGRVVLNIRAADPTSELQSRLDDLDSKGGGTLVIPDTGAELAVRETLRHGADTRIVGQSKGTRIGAIGNFSVFASKTPQTRIDNVEISDLEVRRYGSASTTPLIDWTGVSHSNMRSVKVEQGTAKANSTGILLGLSSYYNNFTGVQVRGVNDGFKLQDAANGNRFNGGTVVLYSTNGYVVDNCNANAFLGASAELLTGTGFTLRSGSKMNQIIGCRIEEMPIGIHVQYSTTPAFNNYIMGNAYYMGAGQVELINETDNVVIDRRMGYVLNNLYASDQRTFIDAAKAVAQASLPIATWTKVLFESVDADHLSEFAGSTFTAKVAGVYTLSTTAWFPTEVAGNQIELSIYKNGELHRLLDRRTSLDSQPTRLAGTQQVKLKAGDRLEVWAKASANVSVTSGRTNTNVQISRAA